MERVARINETGGPEVIEFVALELGAPGPGEVQVRHAACGLNFIDVYYRSGLYPQPLPGRLGLEAAGTIEAVGAGVTDLQVGDRVAYGWGPLGAYATARNLPASTVVRLPRRITFDTAAAMMLQGLTAQYLLRRTYRVQPGDTLLFHAAAGGVGLIVCQWAKALGATVIGTVGSEDKAALAKAHGCDHVINYRHENVAARVRELTEGRGVPVVYDGVGKDTFESSLDSLARFGLMVSFGNASGPVPPFALTELTRRGSLYITRPSLMHYIELRADLEAMAAELFEVVGSGQVRIDVRQRYALSDVAQAHRDLEARRTTGSTILIP
ncbi:quinone oxidoreductase [Sinimarinibacterium sp. CAU 1509]|uniref:quinone oxidoreductase family protein n=1 Tax=Sinimarinibacterium sp. CAU 1509 TaxID=2562283 RepID=UPI0010AC9EA8|nr:quinone oxidoreductase [Sinimarinibacterium sp. CAU 1509]TJY58925.1 quinone oxidoreductase [Sinimarinibacterium sp. CAU 1509]